MKRTAHNSKSRNPFQNLRTFLESAHQILPSYKFSSKFIHQNYPNQKNGFLKRIMLSVSIFSKIFGFCSSNTTSLQNFIKIDKSEVPKTETSISSSKWKGSPISRNLKIRFKFWQKFFPLFFRQESKKMFKTFLSQKTNGRWYYY